MNVRQPYTTTITPTITQKNSVHPVSHASSLRWLLNISPAKLGNQLSVDIVELRVMKDILKPIACVVAASITLGFAHAGDAGWLTSYSKALKLSAKTGKPILADFTGSDWCVFCKKLDAEVFDTSEFKRWAAKNVILLKLDYPETTPQPAELKKQNTELARHYYVKGFPTIYFLDANGKIFGMYGYDRGGPTRWTSMADRLVQPKLHAPKASKASFELKGYPPIIKKTLYAENDFRGKLAPKLFVEKWLSGNAPEMAGKVVLVDFWATWCPGCRDLIPELGAWQKKFGKDLVVIGISDEETGKIKAFMRKTPMPYFVGVDRSDTTSKVIGVQSIPQVLVITPDHVVRWQGYPKESSDVLTTEMLEKIIETSKKHVVALR